MSDLTAEECRPVPVRTEPWGPTRAVCGTHTYFGNGVEPNDWPCHPDTRQPGEAEIKAGEATAVTREQRDGGES